jgi:hypothetical protein
MSQEVVPEYVARMSGRTCFAGHPNLTPACDKNASSDSSKLVTSGSSAGINSPLYYAVVGLPTLILTGDVGIYAMRLVSVLLCAAALAAVFMQLQTLTRSRWATFGAAIGLTPMVLYFSGSINPNAIESASAAALFATLVALVRGEQSKRLGWERAIIGLLAVLFLVNSRSIAFLWLLLIVGAALILAPRLRLVAVLRRPSTIFLIAGSGVVSIAALLWYLHPPRLGVLPGVVTEHGFTTVFEDMFNRTFEFTQAYTGVFGWLDTASPTLSLLIFTVVLIGFLVAAIAFGRGRFVLVVTGFFATVLLVPPVLQAILAPQVGYIWQGRYMLAMVVCLLIACGMAIDEIAAESPLSSPARRRLTVVLVLIAIAQVYSFVWVLRRYVVGTTESMFSMLQHAKWQPPLSWEALTVLFTVWVAVAAVVLYRQMSGDSQRALSVETERTA